MACCLPQTLAEWDQNQSQAPTPNNAGRAQSPRGFISAPGGALSSQLSLGSPRGKISWSGAQNSSTRGSSLVLHSHKPRASRGCFFSLTTSSSTVRRYQSHSSLLDELFRAGMERVKLRAGSSCPEQTCHTGGSSPRSPEYSRPFLVRP